MSEVRLNAAADRYELDCADGPAVAAFEDDGRVRTFTHTVVPPAAEGHGVGSRLVAGALADTRARGLAVVPRCPFVAAYIERHPEWADLLA
jgi:uncharacterized protein